MNNEQFFLNSQEDHYSERLSSMPLQYTAKSTERLGGPGFQSLIDWVNSFNDPYCLLINSINDLKDGKLYFPPS